MFYIVVLNESFSLVVFYPLTFLCSLDLFLFWFFATTHREVTPARPYGDYKPLMPPARGIKGRGNILAL
jgi:hypothetical protein